MAIEMQPHRGASVVLDFSAHPADRCQNPLYVGRSVDGLCWRRWDYTLPNGLHLCWQHNRLRVIKPVQEARGI